MRNIPSLDSGWIEVICGGMCSGKTEELIRRLRRAELAQQNVKIFKAVVTDDPERNTKLFTHSQLSLPCIPVRKPEEIVSQVADEDDVIGIDEIQFFDTSIVDVCQLLADEGKRVICAGLDLDYQAKPFDSTANLLAVAEYADKLQAICMQCGNPASRTQRLVESKERILVGRPHLYEARCRRCHRP